MLLGCCKTTAFFLTPLPNLFEAIVNPNNGLVELRVASQV
jgi:hypothetical protein